MDSQATFKTLKQSVASHLFYLLLTPVSIYRTETSNGFTETENIFPIGLILGPGIAGGNMIAAGSANKKFNQELMDYNINGETKFGLIGIRSKSYDALMLKMK